MMSLLVGFLLGFTQAQDIWSDVNGLNGPGNNSAGLPWAYDYAYDCPTAPVGCSPIPGSVKWRAISYPYNNNVEGVGYSTSAGVSCNRANKVGTTTVSGPITAVLPSADRAIFKGFYCVNDPTCTYPALGASATTGQCSMGRFLKVTQISQGWSSVGQLFKVSVGSGVWSPNITTGANFNCPVGSFMTNMRCWPGATSGSGCIARQIECANFSTPMFRLSALNLNGGPFSNTGTAIPAPKQGSRFRGTIAFVGIKTTTVPDIAFTINQLQIKSCAAGYQLNSTFACVGKPCPVLLAPGNGTVKFSPVVSTPIYPNTATFTCNSGYKTTQTTNSQCQPDATGKLYWTNPTVICTGVPCAPLTDPSNGRVTTTNMNAYPSTANFSCSAGFIVSYTKATCQTSGFWLPSIPADCTGVLCRNDTLYLANNGSIYPTVTSTRYPSTATYTCLPGYYFLSSSQRSCTTTGDWFPQQPECVGVPCPRQSNIPNGNVTQLSVVYPATATYVCKTGFHLVGGAAERVCGTDGVFGGDVPSCDPLPCVAPNASTLATLNVDANASTATGGFSYPSIMTYSCLPGYYPTGSLNQACNAAGDYPPPPSCAARSINVTSLRINSSPINILPVTNAVATVLFSGYFGSTAPSNVTFGPAANPLLYPCSPINFNSGTQTITCTASAGVGANLTLAVILTSPAGAVMYAGNFMSFASPVIRQNTLRAAGNSDVGIVKSFSGSGDKLSFLCDHCGTVPNQLTVAFGAPLPFGINCASITLATTTGDTQNVSCTLGAGAGGPYSFYLTVGSVTISSTDTYKYADGPVIYNVSGCSDTAVGGTSNCPCSGKLGGAQVVLTITGTLFNFSSPTTVKIAQIVYPLISYTATTAKVNLPSGVGSTVSVQIISGASQSQVAFLLGYAAPNIANVSGCINAAECSRAGADIVTITGSNFGTGIPSPLVVLIGTFPCIDVVHDPVSLDGQVTCKMTAGEGVSHGIFAIQPNGLLGSSPTGVDFSYAECPPGTYDDPAGLDCIPCGDGSFSAVPSQSACSLCAAGTYGPTQGLSACREAGQGYFVNSSGSAVRYPCSPGYFTTATQSIVCQPCSPGEFAASPAALGCLSCEAGRATGEFASMGCTECVPGTYSGQTGQTSCPSCVSGSAAPSPAATYCVRCPLGTYSEAGITCSSCSEGTFQNQEGSTTCVQCDPGRYSNSKNTTACASCEQGRFQALYGESNCTLCMAGTYSLQFGAKACSLCVQGTFQNETGQLACNECVIGKQALLPGASVCDACVPGKFASAPRTVVCLDCGVSTANNFSGQGKCTQCARGRYADTAGQLTCTACNIGTYASELGAFVCSACPPGAIANRTGSTICSACNPGTFAKSGGLSNCDACAVGFYAGSDGATVCVQCSPGTFGNLSGLSSCVGCPPGSFSNLFQSKECGACLPGRFSIGNAESCTACGARTIALASGSAACTACPNNAVSNTQLTDCVCGSGFLRVADFQNGVSALQCHPCYQGANCSAPGTTSENLQTLPGWWRSSVATTNYYRCLVAAFCAGGINSDCLGNRAGPLCVSCAPGYRSSRATSACELCPLSANESWTNSVLIMIAVGIVAVGVYWSVLRLGENQVKQMKSAQDDYKLRTLQGFRSSVHGMSRTSVLQTSGSGSGSGESTLDLTTTYRGSTVDEYDPPKKKKNSEEPWSLASRRAPNFLFKIKIVIGFFQIANVISFQGDIAWPQLYQSFITLFQVLNLDFVPWQSIGCATGFDYYWKAIITGLIPVAVLVLLLVGFVLPSMLLERFEKFSDIDSKRLRNRRMLAQLMKLILFTVFLLYPHVSSTVLGVFNCIEVEGVYYLLNDFTLTCFDHRWNNFALPCIIFVLAYPIGIPLAYFFILRKHIGKFQQPQTILAYGFLYDAYQEQTWFFELIDMVHKLVLTSLVPFLPNNMEMACNMIVIILYMQIILALQPYVRKGDDRLHQIVQTELVLLAMLGWTLGNLNESILDPKLDLLISIMLIILTVFLLLSFIVMTARNSFKLIQLFRRLRRKKNQQFQVERGGVLELCASTLKKKNHNGVWQERYFVLCEDGFLEWYGSKSKEHIVAIIPLSQMLAVRDDPNPLKFSWDVKSETTVTFDLQAPDADTASRWVRALNLFVTGNKVEKMDASLTGQYWRDTTAMRMLRLQRSTTNRFKASTGDETASGGSEGL